MESIISHYHLFRAEPVLEAAAAAPPVRVVVPPLGPQAAARRPAALIPPQPFKGFVSKDA